MSGPEERDRDSVDDEPDEGSNVIRTLVRWYLSESIIGPGDVINRVTRWVPGDVVPALYNTVRESLKNRSSAMIDQIMELINILIGVASVHCGPVNSLVLAVGIVLAASLVWLASR